METTPRYSLEHQSSSSSSLLRRAVVPRSDVEDDRIVQQQQLHAVQSVLHHVGSLLQDANDTVTQWSAQPEVVGQAMLRACRDCADALGHLAQQLEEQSEDDRRRLAQACVQDVLENTNNNTNNTNTNNNNNNELATLSADDIWSALPAAAGLLREVEATLRSIEPDEATDIADAALLVAHLFLESLQSLHATVRPEQLTNGMREGASGGGGRSRLLTSTGPEQPTTLRIEWLDDDDDHSPDQYHPNIDSPLSPCVSSATQLPNYSPSSSSHNDTTTRTTPRRQHNSKDRLRVLWPPLGPAVANVLHWGQDAATQQPLLAVALGLTLWPAALLTTLWAAPVLMVDHSVQALYNNFQEAPLVQGLERSAAQLYQTSRLSFLCGKLVARQSLRLVQRHVQQHGGVGTMVQSLGGMAVERVTHPVETMQWTWKGLSWGCDRVNMVYQQAVAAVAQRTDDDDDIDNGNNYHVDERNEATLNLQQ